MPLLTALANLPLYTLNVTVNVHLQSVAVLQIMDRVSKFTNRIREFRHNIGPRCKTCKFLFSRALENEHETDIKSFVPDIEKFLRGVIMGTPGRRVEVQVYELEGNEGGALRSNFPLGKLERISLRLKCRADC